MNVAEGLAAIDEALAGDEPGEAHGVLRQLLGHPADALDDVSDFRRAVGALARLSRAFGAAELAARVEAVAGDPEDVQALYDVGYGLYEEKQLDLAATFFARANRLAPGQPAIVTELAACLEGLLRHGEAALVVERSGLAESVPICAYLSGFNRLMAGDLVTARQRLAQLEGVDEEPIPFVRDALAAMVARGEALESAGIALDDRALTAWHAVISGSLLLHESPHGYDEPMRGRYAYLGDNVALMREGIERLASLLDATAMRPARVVAAPDRNSRILARATAARLGLACADWAAGAEADALVVAWSLDEVGDAGFLQALHPQAPGQLLFVHASCWTDPFPYAPDVTTLLYQTITSPFTGGAMRFDAEAGVVRAEPDARDDDAIARAILADDHADESASPRERVIEVVRALRALPEAQRPGMFRVTGRRIHQRAGGPVPSSRFL